jgi:hypothetical protein
VLNRCAARTLIARETAERLIDHDPPALVSRIGQRVGFADAARSGRLIGEVDENRPAAREIVASPRGREDRAMSERDLKRAFAAHPSDAEAWVRNPESPPSRHAEPSLYTARLTIDVTPGQRGRIKVAAFRRGLTVADMLRALLAREFPEHDGGA